MIRTAGGNCGCGRPGACWEAFACGCEWDHGDMRRCPEHELEHQAEELASRADAAADWARDTDYLSRG